VLAIGGVGGLAVGLAGREILENLFTGLIILSSSPFEVGDEVLFTPPSGSVRPPFGCRRPLSSTAACVKLQGALAGMLCAESPDAYRAARGPVLWPRAALCFRWTPEQLGRLRACQPALKRAPVVRAAAGGGR